MDHAKYPNPILEPMNETELMMMGERLKAAADNCSNPEVVRWGACNIMYPKCLLGETLQLCRQTCLGKVYSDSHKGCMVE